MPETYDLNIQSTRPLPTPRQLQAEIPVLPAHAELVTRSRRAIEAVLAGRDPRLLVIIGPCSIHDVEAGRDYARRLAQAATALSDRLLVVMRVYFEKPRTTVGWKGLIMDPHLDGSHDIPAGLRLARSFLREILDLGLPTATELLDPITPQYIADLICWSAIGARTTESQIHRQLASGLSMPLGFKNGTDGSLQVAVHAITAARQSQTFMGISREGVASAVTTRGNPWCHLVLRGGRPGPNYDRASIAAARSALAQAGQSAAILVDCSHDNSAKRPERQPEVAREVLAQVAEGAPGIVGLMVESNLEAGNQAFPQPRERLRYGVSITDGCIDWPTTAALLEEAAAAVAAGRAGISCRS